MNIEIQNQIDPSAGKLIIDFFKYFGCIEK